jgi:hypothetical protein
MVLCSIVFLGFSGTIMQIYIEFKLIKVKLSIIEVEINVVRVFYAKL